MNYAWLFAALSDGADVVTATERLARELRAVHDRQQIALGARAWRTPRILPWAVWLRTLLESARPSADGPLQLEGPATAVLWETCLREKAGDRLLNVPGLARQMQLTWQRVEDWQIPLDRLVASAETGDQRLFAAVAGRYRRTLAGRGWADTSGLARRATEAVRDGDIRPPPLLLTAGFERLHPAAAALLAALSAAGCSLREAPAADRRERLELVAAADADAELRAAGAWAARRLADDPEARIAIVTASLPLNASRCSRLVREGIAPGWQFGEPLRRGAVNVSYGRRLAEYPLVAVALLWLQWAQRGLDSREVGILLRSRAAGSATLDARDRLEAVLRRLPNRSWTPAALVSALRERRAARDAADWLRQLQSVTGLAAASAVAASPAVWAGRVAAFLDEVGWPGSRPMDSAEFQLVNRWRELLNDLSLLEPVRPRLRFPEAFARIASLASEAVFQPETRAGMVQLVGPLEAAGLEFDAVWVAGLEAMQWPGPAGPLPLVSRALQREAGMPDALPADTLERSRRILGRIAGSAASVVLSWPLGDGDAELAPSPLLDEYRPRAARDSRAQDPGWFASRVSAFGSLRQEHADPVPPVTRGERVTGGAYTVQRQFEEPFSAFVFGRLGVRRLPPIETGLSAGLRGRLVHAALRELLQDLPSDGTLREWAAGDLDRRIGDALRMALKAPALYADAVLQRLLALERVRLARLLRTFVAAELARPAFTVAAVEAPLTLERHGVALALQVDRIDRLGDGSLLVVDYKSGALRNLQSRRGEPVEWQPVVYACALGGPVGGLVLINLDARGIVYRGTGADVPWSPLGAAAWSRRLAEWSRRVEQEIGRLAAGDVRVDLALSAEASRPLNILSRSEALKRGG